jgi:hypothetical protein
MAAPFAAPELQPLSATVAVDNRILAKINDVFMF